MLTSSAVYSTLLVEELRVRTYGAEMNRIGQHLGVFVEVECATTARCCNAVALLRSSCAYGTSLPQYSTIAVAVYHCMIAKHPHSLLQPCFSFLPTQLYNHALLLYYCSSSTEQY